jgi:hypothetical protein|eukprot:COSAG01_NODE_7730_length_3080_cov_2751.699094_6_plen_62_part_00
MMCAGLSRRAHRELLGALTRAEADDDTARPEQSLGCAALIAAAYQRVGCCHIRGVQLVRWL